MFLGRIGQIELDAEIGKPNPQQLELKLNDAFDLRECQRLEQDDVVHAVKKFRAKVGPQFCR